MTQSSTIAHPVARRAATFTRLGLLAALVVGLGLSAALSHHSTGPARDRARADTSVETVSSTQRRPAPQHAVLRSAPGPAPTPEAGVR